MLKYRNSHKPSKIYYKLCLETFVKFNKFYKITLQTNRTKSIFQKPTLQTSYFKSRLMTKKPLKKYLKKG